MTLSVFLQFVVGIIFGVLIGQIFLMFFDKEFYRFIDKMVLMVRKKCGLE